VEEKFNTLTHKIVIQLHLMAESCTIYSTRSRQPVQKLLDTPSYCNKDEKGITLLARENVLTPSTYCSFTLFCSKNGKYLHLTIKNGRQCQESILLACTTDVLVGSLVYEEILSVNNHNYIHSVTRLWVKHQYLKHP
jgi:hypothetical protein